MADDKSFKELIQEQKQTNKLLMQQISSDARGSDLGTSIKNSAGEIINDVLIGSKQRKESNQTQAIIKKGNEQKKDLDEKNQKANFEIFTKMSTSITSVFSSKKGSSARDDEDKKDKANKQDGMFKKYLGKGSFLNKNFTKGFGKLKDTFSKLYGKGKGILKVLFGVAAYGLLLKYLNSPGFKEFMKNDAPAKIAAAAKKIFGEGGLLDQIGDFFGVGGEKGGSKKMGLFGHLKAILGGFLGITEKGGFAAIGDALTAIKRAIFGGGLGEGVSGPPEADNSLLGGMSTFSKIILGIGAAMTLPLILGLMPGLFVKGTLLFLGVIAIVEAIKAINNLLFDSAGAMNEETGKRDDAGIEKVLPVTKGSAKRIFGNRGFSSGGMSNAAKGPSGGMFIKGLDGKLTATPATKSNTYGSKSGNAAQRVMGFFDGAPKWLKKTFGGILKRVPLLGQAMLAGDMFSILSGDLPFTANPDQPSKAQALFSLMGNISGMTLGGMLGSLIPIPILGTLGGMFLGGELGGSLGTAAYKAMWLYNNGVTKPLDLAAAMVTSGGNDTYADGSKVGLVKSKRSDQKMIPENVANYGSLGSGFNFFNKLITTRGGDPNRPAPELNMVPNPRYIEPAALATNKDEYFKKLGMDTPIVIQKKEGDNNSTVFTSQKQISSSINDAVYGGGVGF